MAGTRVESGGHQNTGTSPVGTDGLQENAGTAEEKLEGRQRPEGHA